MGLKWNCRVWAMFFTILAGWQFALLAAPGEADYAKVDAYLAVFVLVLFIPNFFETHIQGMLDYHPDDACLLILCGALALMSTIAHLLLLKKLQLDRFSPARPAL